ncbi:twin-arginine translocase TatA/TatE family subunit [Hyalangium rubrum]|uniref:Twin-arginine translocase TatA/TatE family subunit n=1 Tax=Hyalangium rubrum TaxID=3103134 RepID=A0ABU5HF77_9BACT|nr:twin-arginine translocase TatA/TatE family subunit [Hyalangium sp. s54d21]MDY7231915.1 twin-arginine translocase TatA/TatE family subunit [Hyalangium sp. s54d21]
MFNIGAGEMIFILVAALLILGPQRLPELARGIGKFLREFRRQTDEVRSVVTREFYQMDQEFQREPPRPVPAPVPPVEHPAMSASEPAALPPPAHVPAHLEGGNYAHMMPPPEVLPAVEAAPAVEPQSLGATVAAVAAQGEPVAPQESAPAETSGEQEEAVPRFAPIPGTVARNAPKQG